MAYILHKTTIILSSDTIALYLQYSNTAYILHTRFILLMQGSVPPFPFSVHFPRFSRSSSFVLYHFASLAYFCVDVTHVAATHLTLEKHLILERLSLSLEVIGKPHSLYYTFWIFIQCDFHGVDP